MHLEYTQRTPGRRAGAALLSLFLILISGPAAAVVLTYEATIDACVGTCVILSAPGEVAIVSIEVPDGPRVIAPGEISNASLALGVIVIPLEGVASSLVLSAQNEVLSGTLDLQTLTGSGSAIVFPSLDIDAGTWTSDIFSSTGPPEFLASGTGAFLPPAPPPQVPIPRSVAVFTLLLLLALGSRAAARVSRGAGEYVTSNLI